MDVEANLKEYALKIADAIFSKESEVEIGGQNYQIQVFKGKKLRYVDIYGFRFIEQNPNKTSQWAQKAREGSKILWVFRGRSYYARVIDGHFTLLKKNH